MAPVCALLPPNRLLSDTASKDKTVWTVTLSTGRKRGSQLSELSPVLLCLTGQQGAAILKVISPLSEFPNQSALRPSPVEEGSDSHAYADRSSCEPSSAEPASSAGPSAAAVRRFQEGSIDRFQFEGPDIGPVESIMIAPQQGTWQPDEVLVASASRGDHSDRFLCGQKLGTSLFSAAAHLQAISPDVVPYGSGEARLLLSQEEAESKHMEGLAGYTTFKQEVLQATAGVIGCGTLSLSVLSGRDPALAFLAGGMAGLAYQRLLQLSVDAVPGGAKASALQQAGPSSRLRQLAGRPQLRVVLLAAFAVALLTASSEGGKHLVDLPRSSSSSEAATLLLGLLGFLVQQIVLVVVAAQSPR